VERGAAKRRASRIRLTSRAHPETVRALNKFPVKTTSLVRQYLWVSLCAVVLLSRSFGQEQCALVPGITAWWRAEATAADDLGAIQGSAPNGVQYPSGKVGKAFLFSGLNQYIRIPAAKSLSPTGSFSIDAWIFPQQARDQDILSKWSNNERSYILAVTRNNGLRFGISDSAHQSDGSFHVFDTAPNIVPLNAWSHVAAVYEQTTGRRRIFLNGVEVAQRTDAPITVLDSNVEIAIGARQALLSTAVDFFAGMIDEISFYGRALSETEVRSIWQVGSAGKCDSTLAVTIEPRTQALRAGDDSQLIAVATGGTSLAYQWWFNNAALPGATNAVLILRDVQLSDAGTYRVLVSSMNGNVTSADGTVSVEPASSCAPLGSGAVSWWAFDSLGADRLMVNPGRGVNGVGLSDGRVGKALKLSGVNQYVQIPSSASLLPGGSFTIEAWVNPSQTRDQDILSKWANHERSYILALTANNGVRFGISDAAHQLDGPFHIFDTVGNVVPLSAWSHVAGVYDQSTGKRSIYVNGLKVAERVDPPITVFRSNNDAAIGARQAELDLAVDFFVGELDEVTLYQRALSGEELKAIYEARATGKCEIESSPECVNAPQGLVGWWGGEGSARDLSNFGNEASAINVTYAPGKAGSSFVFNGQTSALQVPSSSTLAAKSLTWTAWIYPTDDAPHPLMEHGDDNDLAGVLQTTRHTH
jgi:hypothetical protein